MLSCDEDSYVPAYETCHHEITLLHSLEPCCVITSSRNLRHGSLVPDRVTRLGVVPMRLKERHQPSLSAIECTEKTGP